MLHMDYHVHCKNSPDSSEPLDEICQGAVDAGLTEIMVTDHYELFTDDYWRAAFDLAYLDQCLDSVMECREKDKHRLYIGF